MVLTHLLQVNLSLLLSLLLMILFLLIMMLLLMMFMQMQHRSNLVRIRVDAVQGIPLQRPFEARRSAVESCLACEGIKLFIGLAEMLIHET